MRINRGGGMMDTAGLVLFVVAGLTAAVLWIGTAAQKAADAYARWVDWQISLDDAPGTDEAP